MLNDEIRDTNGGKPAAPENRSWRQKNGAALMIGVFALLAIVMVLVQKNSLR